jgi:hypothetical protein
LSKTWGGLTVLQTPLFGVISKARLLTARWKVLEHLPAGFLTLAALRRAFFHMLVVELRALLAAAGAGLRASLADEIAENATPRRYMGGRAAEMP